MKAPSNRDVPLERRQLGGWFEGTPRLYGSRETTRAMSRGPSRRKKPKPKVKPFVPGPLQNPENYGEFSLEESDMEDDEGLAEEGLSEEKSTDETDSEVEDLLTETGVVEKRSQESTVALTATSSGMGSKEDQVKVDEEEEEGENPEEFETWGIQQPLSVRTNDSKVAEDNQNLDRVGYRSSGGRIDFRRLKDWEEVRDVVRELGDRIEPRQISHALGALKFCYPKPAQEFLEEMAELAISLVHQLPPMDLACVLHAFAKMKFVHKSLVRTWEKELSDPQILEACTDMDISTIVYSTGVLQREMVWGLSNRDRGNSGGFSTEFVKVLAEEAAHPLRVQHYSETMLSNTFYGLALLRCGNKQALDKLLEEASLPSVINGFTAQNLSSLIYSMGVLGHRNHKALQAFLSAILDRIDESSEQGLSNIVYSLGQLRFTDLETIKPLWPVICQPDRLTSFTEQDLSNIVHGLGLLGIDNEEVFGPIKRELLREGRLQEFRERGLTGMLFALGQLRHNDMNLLSAIVKELTGSRLKGCRPQGLAVAVYSLGILKYSRLQDLTNLFYEVSQPNRVSMFSDQELANVIHGLGHLRHRDEDVFIPLAEEATSPHRLRTFTQQALATIAHTFANLGFRHPHFLDKVANEVSKPGRLADFTEQSFILTVAAFVRLGHFDKYLFTAFLEECLSPARKTTMRMNPFSDTMFGCVKSSADNFNKFEEIIEVFHDPEKLANTSMFPLARMLLVCGQIGLRDDKFLKNVRTELLKPERVESMRDDDRRDLGRAFERFGWFDEDLIKILDYPATGRGAGSYRRAQPPAIRGGDGAHEDDSVEGSEYLQEGLMDNDLGRSSNRRSGRGVGRGRGDPENSQYNRYQQPRRYAESPSGRSENDVADDEDAKGFEQSRWDRADRHDRFGIRDQSEYGQSQTGWRDRPVRRDRYERNYPQDQGSGREQGRRRSHLDDELQYTRVRRTSDYREDSLDGDDGGRRRDWGEAAIGPSRTRSRSKNSDEKGIKKRKSLASLDDIDLDWKSDDNEEEKVLVESSH